MISKLLGFLGDSNDKQVKRLDWLAKAVASFESSYSDMQDQELTLATGRFRERLADGESLENLMPEAFAAVREAARRAIGLRHFDVQLIGGAVLHQGKVAEMKTGEGKTLVATLALYLASLDGKGAHLVTVNDYLARRDTLWMGPIYTLLGVTVACLQHEEAFFFVGLNQDEKKGKYPGLQSISRKDAYAADITYGTNNEFGFDYLRDNMVVDLPQRVQRELHYAIVDEVDNILIDEARTPLIISGPAQESTKLYQRFAQVIPSLLLDEDYTVAEKERNVLLTETGMTKLEQILKIDNLYDPDNYSLTHFVENALRAHAIYTRDKDYVVSGGEVVIVDEFTGRLMEGRRYSDGLHQALEAKERLRVQQESVTYATITLQNYFRMYSKLAGMTGTAVTEAEEFYKVYKLDVVSVPTNRPVIREDLPDLIYKNEPAKFQAIADEILKVNKEGAPILVGTVSIERSEYLSQILRRRGIKHEVLNAKQHEREAMIISQAGRPGAVTVATNMAGRGTDIILGGDPKSTDSIAQWDEDNKLVVSLGGLFIIGTERHESRRIDNQLRGRSGRQGDPGLTRFYGSLEDDIMRRFGGDRVKSVMDWVKLPDEVPLEGRIITRVVDSTQGKVETHNFDIRKHLVEYDDVVNTQRERIYSDRLKTLEEEDLSSTVKQLTEQEISGLTGHHLVGEPDGWDLDAFTAELTNIFPGGLGLEEETIFSKSGGELTEEILVRADELYDSRKIQFGPETMTFVEKNVMLQVIDRSWVQHLTAMQNLRQGIGLQAYGQRDPLIMYKMEGRKLFETLLTNVRQDIVRAVFHWGHDATSQKSRSNNGGSVSRGKAISTGLNGNGRGISTVMTSVVTRQTSSPSGTKVGRNDPCPCGSGKKYKRCHGLNG